MSPWSPLFGGSPAYQPGPVPSFRWFSVGPVEFAGSVCLQQEGQKCLFLRISAQNMGLPINGWMVFFEGESIYKWMIWWYPHFRKPSHGESLLILGLSQVFSGWGWAMGSLLSRRKPPISWTISIELHTCRSQWSNHRDWRSEGVAFLWTRQ